MQRRDYLKLVGSAAGALSVGSQPALAADSELDCGVWYDAEIIDTVDGDTFDVHVYDNGKEYNVRTLGHDTPEKSGNTRYEKTEEWEFIEDAAHLEDWGNRASQFAEDELPVGTQVQIELDCESDEIDQYDRLLAKIRYDRSGDGSMDTVWNELTVEKGYARVYSASLSNADEYFDLERAARDAGRGVWSGADGSAPEWRNRDVAETFHPHTSSIRTTEGNGRLADSRVPVWAEPEAVQENTASYTVDYESGSVPLVGVDEANNVAYFGGCTINEEWEEESAALEHFVFVTNLVDYLHDSDDPSGPVLVDGGHHTFGQNNAVSAEDTAFYQRYLEGVGIELHGIHSYGNGKGYSLSEARALVASAGPDQWTSSEISEVNSFLDDGGVLLLMGSGSETSDERANLNDLAAGVGTDLRLNYDDVRDDANNVGNRKLLKTANLNTADFSLWSAYGGSGGSDDSVVEFGTVNQYPHDALNDEYVEITNAGNGDQDVTGWTLENGDGDVYQFPDGFTLTAGSSVRVHTGSGTDSSTDLYWGESTFRWDNDADTAALYDDQGSLVRETSWALDDVIIPAVSEDGDTLNDEWVEFRNVSGDSVDLTGWRVEDGAGYTYQFPDGFTLSDGATVRLHTGSGTDSDTDLYWGRGSAVWNNSGDTAFLYDGDDNLVQKHTYPAPYSASVTEVSVQQEYVDVTNEGSSLLDMSGWTLADEAGYTYEFPDSFTLGAGDTVRVHTGEGEDTRTDLYWGMGISVWNDDGDTAFLYDDNERLADQQASGDSGEGSGDDVLVADPNTAGSSSYHTWTLADASNDFSGEVDAITVEYPSGTSLDGLTDDDVQVFMDRDGDGSVDEIKVNSDSYAGSAATFDLDGRYNTSVEGEVRVEIDGVTNPDAGEYVSTETLDGDDTHSVEAEFVVE